MQMNEKFLEYLKSLELTSIDCSSYIDTYGGDRIHKFYLRFGGGQITMDLNSMYDAEILNYLSTEFEELGEFYGLFRDRK